MDSFQVIINGRNATESAEKLVVETSSAGNLLQQKKQEEGTRSVDWSAIVEFFQAAQPIVTTLGGTVTIAHTLWKWRRELKPGQDVTIKKKKDGKEEKIDIYPNTSEKEIEDFLELKPLEKLEQPK